MKKAFFLVGTFVTLLLYAPALRAQKNEGHDDSYYTSFNQHRAVRLFLAQKYATLFFRTKDTKDIRYIANTKLHLGVGFTAHNVSLSGSVGIGYLRNNGKDKGKTTSYDFQVHAFPYKWAIDGFIIYNKGYHLNQPDIYPVNTNTYYYRPDIQLGFLGADAYRVANAGQFSYRAAMGQSEWQKKSAGSFLYGGNISYGRIKGDSAMIPSQLENIYQQAGIKTINFFHAGPGVGYAYTLVAEQHFFLMASLVGNLNINITSEEKSGNKSNTVSVMPGALYKAALGYNSSDWGAAVDLAGNALLIKGKLQDGGYILPIGIYRLTVTRKFAAKKK